jgi:glycosyltransferase involved in cell wall biosynthesis
MLKLSIVTVHLNQRESLKYTLESVRNSGFPANSVELIVVDGGSSFNINDLFAEFDDIISLAISEPDRGVFDAMNKGLRLARGEYINFMNAGDAFCSGVLSGSFLDSLNNDIIYGDYILYLNGLKTLQRQTNELDFAYFLGRTICHQSIIYRTDLCKKYPYRLDYSLMGDWIQLFNLLKNESLSIRKLDFPLCIYDGHGQSDRFKDDRLKQRSDYLKSVYSDWELSTLTLIARLRQRHWYNWLKDALSMERRNMALKILSRYFP